MRNCRSTITRIFRFAFKTLYHQFAWSYDLVSWLVSFGRWRNWTRVILGYLDLPTGGQILELGFGPGHLQKAMIHNGMACVGLDESRQMCKLASRRLNSAPSIRNRARLVRGRAEALPFADSSFAVVVATFPAEYIFHESTLSGCGRVLQHGGRLIFLVGVQPGGFSILDRILKGIYRLTNQGFEFESRPDSYFERLKALGIQAQLVTTVDKQDRLWVIDGHKV